MSRLTEQILDEFKDINYAYNDSSKFDTLKRMLKDAVEVVRCRECKYWHPNGIGFCTIHDICPSQLDMADWFCADGERKSE